MSTNQIEMMLRQAISDHELCPSALAREAGMTQPQMSLFLKRGSMTIKTLQKYANVLGLTLVKSHREEGRKALAEFKQKRALEKREV